MSQRDDTAWTDREAWPYAQSFEVRDYELDLQGIVNNANYLHYFEHARHGFIKARRLDFAALHEAGYDPVVYHAELDYREPLRSGESFEVLVRARAEGRLKLVFEERLLKAGGRESARGIFVVAVVHEGRPCPLPEAIVAALGLDTGRRAVAPGD